MKLWQFDPEDRTSVRMDTSGLNFEDIADRPGVTVAPLFSDDREVVRLERWAAGARITLDVSAGMELLVLEGGFAESGETFTRHSWLRLPAGAHADASAGDAGCTVWVKTGHPADRAKAGT